jgi:transposase
MLPTLLRLGKTAEQLDREPAKYFVRVLRREKRARSSCAQGGVQTVGSPARIIEKSIVSDQVIIDTVVTKYCDYVPLYRQSAILEREVGLVWISLI